MSDSPEFEFETPVNEDPEEWELIGGPYDGSIFRCSSGVLNTPPKAILLEVDISSGGTSLDHNVIKYKLFQEHTQDGEPIGEIHYRFVR